MFQMQIYRFVVCCNIALGKLPAYKYSKYYNNIVNVNLYL